ncbi:MAG: cell division protein FtsQ/DivIB [Actinomycetota bacterium]
MSERDDESVEINLDEVSDDVRDELARLFGADETAPGGSAIEVIVDDGSGLTGSGEIGAPTGSADAGLITPTPVGPSESGGSSTAADRPIVPIGDLSADSVAPLPIDPLVPVPGGGGVIQIVDDGTMPEVRDVGDVSRVLIVDDDQPAGRVADRDSRRAGRRGRRGKTVGRGLFGLGRVKWLRLGAVGTVVFIVIAIVLASPIFAIRTVVFDGTVYTDASTIEDVRAMLDGSSVFTADVDLARQRMLEDPWVAEVRITTDFPGRAVVEVAERVPVVWYAGDDQKARVIDARGHVIAVLEGWPTKYLQVRGTGPSLEAGATADDAYRAAAQLVLALPDEIAGRVEVLDLSPGGELSMFLKGGTIVRFGPPEGLQDKLVAVVVLMRRQDPSTLAVVDVSTGEPTVQTR